jgi:hypothetical protein
MEIYQRNLSFSKTKSLILGYYFLFNYFPFILVCKDRLKCCCDILDRLNLYSFLFVLLGATHIVHHYVPGQPFYIREMVFWKVKSFMVSQGVRLNDFGVVTRANRYFNDPHALLATASKTETQDISTVEAVQKRIAPNNSHTWGLVSWLLLCSTIGTSAYVVYDQIVSGCLALRIVQKYVFKYDSHKVKVV